MVSLPFFRSCDTVSRSGLCPICVSFSILFDQALRHHFMFTSKFSMNYWKMVIGIFRFLIFKSLI